MELSATTSRRPRRRPLPPLSGAWAAAALLFTACAPAAPSVPSSITTAAAGEGAANSPATPPAAQPTPARNPATTPIDIPVRPAAPPAQAPAPPAPISLTVAGTSINMTVVPVGVSPDKAMEIPEAFDQAGWYRFGPAPGAGAGTAVIAGHIDTTSDRAPFSQLKALAAGTVIQVGRQSLTALNYRVVSVELMAKDSFNGDALFRRDGPHELKVVTCGGRWLDERMDYSDNVIVTAVLE